jgi:hypothetical protein
VRDVAAPYPVTVFMRMMGLPLARFDEFRHLADEFFKAVGPEAVGKISQQIIGALAGLLQERMQNPHPEKADIIDHLVDAKINGEPVAFDKMISTCFLLFLGGLDTVTNALSFGCRYLATRPDLQKRMRENPDLITPFVEESLRLYGVVNTPRIVVKDLEKFGVRFKTGDMLLNCLPMAGWDPTKPFEQDAFFGRCMALGKQYQLQRRIRSAESLSRVLFETALKLARDRRLVDPDPSAPAALAQRRRAFADEIRATLKRVDAIGVLAASRRAGLLD